VGSFVKPQVDRLIHPLTQVVLTSMDARALPLFGACPDLIYPENKAGSINFAGSERE